MWHSLARPSEIILRVVGVAECGIRWRVRASIHRPNHAEVSARNPPRPVRTEGRGRPDLGNVCLTFFSYLLTLVIRAIRLFRH
jgi:hypothetical protein